MRHINVKAAEGRIAYDAPRGGKRIPTDKFVPVIETPYVRRLIDIHHDLIEEATGAAPAAADTAGQQPATPPVVPVATVTPKA